MDRGQSRSWSICSVWSVYVNLEIDDCPMGPMDFGVPCFHRNPLRETCREYDDSNPFPHALICWVSFYVLYPSKKLLRCWVSCSRHLEYFRCCISPGCFGAGVGRHSSTWNMHPPPRLFWASKRRGGGPPDAKLYPGYIRIYQVDIMIYIDQKSKPRMTSANSYSWSLKILRHGILLLQWNLWVGGF